MESPAETETSRPVALVTGASSGVGRATAHLFAASGFRTFGTSRRSHSDEDGVEMLMLDVASGASVAQCVEQVLTRAGRIDVLVNNAGMWQASIAEETPLSTARAIFETNFFGVVRVTDAVLPGMRKRRKGRIINVGSLAAWVGEPGESFYAASKKALSGYTEALRHEVWPLGIHVSLVEPGALRTHLAQTLHPTENTIDDYGRARESIRKTLERALSKGGDPEKAARVIVKVALSRVPRFRYGVGSVSAGLPFLKTLLPQRAFDRLVRRGFGLTKTDSRQPTAR
jgi:NAD(P)-dependent dehydrogenase (short-subunit alcohol dehydrogenase family)